MTLEAQQLAQVEERLAAGEVPTDAVSAKVLLEAMRYYRRCRHRRGARASSERRAHKQPKVRAPRPRRGHGRLGAKDYAGAERVVCPHSELHAGGVCPSPNCTGKLYAFKRDDDVVLSGTAPIQAVIYEREVLRCASCLTVFKAPLPEQPTSDGAKPAEGVKCQPSVDAALSVMRYGLGLPHHRLEQWQKWAEVPLPSSTQFERVEKQANALLPVHREYERLAANRPLWFGDDTGVRILTLQAENRSRAPGERTGTYTTGLVARGLAAEVPALVLYVSGRRHAGENLDRLLEKRAPDQPDVLHMADAASRSPRSTRRTQAHCLVHGRRYFIEAHDAFPTQCDHVLDALGQVFQHDAQTRDMDPCARLAYHQQHSAPVMTALREWLDEQLRERRVEPNGQLGRAIRYMQRHWDGLTRFLHVPGAPLENNTVYAAGGINGGMPRPRLCRVGERTRPAFRDLDCAALVDAA